MELAAGHQFIPYRAPREAGQTLSVPPLASIDDSLSGNRRLLDHAETSISGFPLGSLRSTAKHQAQRIALRYCQNYLPISLPQSDSLFFGGHQPELFHPGVWLKNFALGVLAEKHQAVAVNLVVDNDICHRLSIAVPYRGNDSRLASVAIPFDRADDGLPWEVQGVSDSECWNSFAPRIKESMKPWGIAPLIEQLWPEAIRASGENWKAGASLARARHSLEFAAGNRTLEVPLSQLVEVEAFGFLFAHLLTSLEDFHSTYNDCLTTYRLANGIRSESHPVPKLEANDGWHELPLWVYSLKSPRRRRLFARRIGDSIQWTDRAGWREECRINNLGKDCATWIPQWNKQGIFVRPRALLTTIFVRLFLADWFLHGIGGGKYDQLTDLIIEQFFAMEAPKFSVVTGTTFLPLEKQPDLDSTSLPLGKPATDYLPQLQTLRQLPRLIENHPEQFVSPSSLANQRDTFARLRSEKMEMLRAIPPRGEKMQWHQQLVRINRELAAELTSEIENARQKIRTAEELYRELRILRSREFSFCLYDQEQIIPQLRQMTDQLFDP